METHADALPPELAELDAELSSIRYEERQSFAPELESELAREWHALQGRRYWPVRQLMAAAIAGLLLAGMGVPSARAAVVGFVGRLSALVEETLGMPEPRRVPTPSVTFPAEGAAEPPAPVLPQPPTAPLPAYEGTERFGAPEATPPSLLDRSHAETLIQQSYPILLQRAGIGGSVGVLLWVDSTGAVGFVNLGKSSGIPDLDGAALKVAPSLRFEPARRRGRAVGTWVEFNVRFEPAAGGGGDRDSAPGER